MSDVTMEQKLRLVQQIRSRYNEDQYDMSNRERILYGKSVRREYCRVGADTETPETPPALSSFKVRLVLAALLAVLLIAMDKNDSKIAGITSNEIFRAISADFEDDMAEWVAAMSESTETFSTTDGF